MKKKTFKKKIIEDLCLNYIQFLVKARKKYFFKVNTIVKTNTSNKVVI